MDQLPDMDSPSPDSEDSDIPATGAERVTSKSDGPPDPSGPERDPDSPLPVYSRRDIMWLGGLGLSLVVVAVTALSLFFGNITTSTADYVDFPVQGKHLNVAKIETYWRKVDRETDTGVQLGTKFIPVADITLKDSGNGTLRFLFENPQGDLIGDSVTLVARAGTFENSNQRTATIHATGGFKDAGDYNEYVTEQVRFWKLVILEGPADTQDQPLSPLLRMPISPKRR